MFSPLTLTLALLSLRAAGAPAGISSLSPFPETTATHATATPTVSPARDATNAPLWGPDTTGVLPEAVRGQLGANILGPHNVPIELENPDLLAPPTTDEGLIPNAKWPFALSNNRLQTGGWARQQNEDQMPIATSLAGVDMRLEPGAIRELHWHSTAEWAYVLEGSCQITSVDQNGRNYLATVNKGDLWYFPAGIPHSLQGTNATADGTEFLLVFPSGTFNEDDTFLLTEWLAHVPKEVLAKNFGTDMSAFAGIPGDELYIFPSDPLPTDATAPTDPNGRVPDPFSYALSQQAPTRTSNAGSIKIVDSAVFKASKEIAMAEVSIEPGHMRELHWHPTEDEWSYFVQGQGRITLFASGENARTWNYQAGDIAYIPASYGHYIENTGNNTLIYLEISNTDRYQDMSLSQWLANTPAQLVKAHLNISDATVAKLTKEKEYVV